MRLAWRSAVLISGIAALPALALANTPGAPPTIEHISMRLLNIFSGTLSGDIAPPAQFDGWNTIIGEGSASEPANDMLVTVRLKGAADGTGAGGFQPVVIEARNGRGKIVGSHKADPHLADTNGRAHVAMWLHNIGCAGNLTITARMGKVTKTSFVHLECGE